LCDPRHEEREEFSAGERLRHPGYEGPRILLREEGVSFQHLKTWKGWTDPEFAQKKARIERLYAIADGEAQPRAGEPETATTPKIRPSCWEAQGRTETRWRVVPIPGLERSVWPVRRRPDGPVSLAGRTSSLGGVGRFERRVLFRGLPRPPQRT
jgi:hypothetical protein